MANKTKSATFNTGLISDEALSAINAAHDEVIVLSIAEQDLAKARKALKDGGETDKKVIASATQRERFALNKAKDDATFACSAFVSRFVSTKDFAEKNWYSFDVAAMLVNMGCIKGDPADLKNRAVEKVEAFRSEVVDRFKTSITKRRKGDSFLTYGKTTEVKNDVVELVLAICDGLVSAGALEYSKGKIVRKVFEETQTA